MKIIRWGDRDDAHRLILEGIERAKAPPRARGLMRLISGGAARPRGGLRPQTPLLQRLGPHQAGRIPGWRLAWMMGKRVCQGC